MESSRFDIAVVGELNPDLILSGEVVPEFDQVEKLVDRATLTIGSSSAIFACGAARLGLRVAFIGKVGQDLFGEYMLQSLAARGIDTHGIVTDPNIPTGISVILTRGIDRAILTYPGTIPRLKYTDIDQDIIRSSRHLHVASYYIQEDLRPDLPELFGSAHAWGLTVSLDTNYDPKTTWNAGINDVLDRVDLFLPNTVELLGITAAVSLDEAMEQLCRRVSYLGVKLGGEGAILCHDHEQYKQDAIQVPVVDTVGAGDSFDAGFVYAYLAGFQCQQILKFATICGSLSTRSAGGTAAQPGLHEAMSYL